MKGPLQIGDVLLESRFFLGTAGYPSPQVLHEAIQGSGTQVVTVSLKRQMAAVGMGAQSTSDAAKDPQPAFFQMIQASGARLLPNTAGCSRAQEAITLAMMAREMFGTHWIKLEVVGDDYTLQPDPVELVEAARVLVKEGFEVFPYCTEDLVSCRRLLDAGCRILMPWGSPIGSGQGLTNPHALRTLRARLPDTILVLDAGIGAPSHAAQAMEMGFDAVLVNSAVSQSHDPVNMAKAIGLAVQAGRLGYEAGIMAKQDMAVPTTPVTGRPFLL